MGVSRRRLGCVLLIEKISKLTGQEFTTFMKVRSAKKSAFCCLKDVLKEFREEGNEKSVFTSHGFSQEKWYHENPPRTRNLIALIFNI